MVKSADEITCPLCGQAILPEQSECQNCGMVIERELPKGIHPEPEIPPVQEKLPIPEEKSVKKEKPQTVAKKSRPVQNVVPVSQTNSLVSLSDSLQILMDIAHDYEQSGNMQGALATYRKARAFGEKHQGDDSSIGLTMHMLDLLIQRTQQILERNFLPELPKSIPEKRTPTVRAVEEIHLLVEGESEQPASPIVETGIPAAMAPPPPVSTPVLQKTGDQELSTRVDDPIATIEQGTNRDEIGKEPEGMSLTSATYPQTKPSQPVSSSAKNTATAVPKIPVPKKSRRSWVARAGALVVVGILIAGLVLPRFFNIPLLSRIKVPAATELPVPTETPILFRHGGWLDQIVFSAISTDSALTQLQAGAIDVYGYGLKPAQLASIQGAGLNYAASSYSNMYYDILYNPSVCSVPYRFNPFSDHKIREATNRLYDRDYINQEIYAGADIPQFFAIQENGIDFNELTDVTQNLEAQYAFDETAAIADITSEMTNLGATMGTNGRWQYRGQAVTLIFLIRSDSDGTRRPLGDYVSAQLEKAGFTVDRQYKKSSEASPIWISSDPAECQWNLYTAAWANLGLERDEKQLFQEFYLPNSTQGINPILENKPDPVFQQVGDDLANANFSTRQQWHELMAQALALSLQDSLQVFLISGRSFSPSRHNIQMAVNLASGIRTSPIAFYTLRFAGQEGGTMNWGEPDLCIDPWNPVAGSNWDYDQVAMTATSGAAFMLDPTTGLQWPLRAERAELTVQRGLPIWNTLDWVKVTTADSIVVPPEAWVDWDAASQQFITAGSGRTASIKSTIHYPADMFDVVTWHDGSKLSVADFVMTMIMTFDRAKPASAIYDETNAVPVYDDFMNSFRGVRIISTSPLVIETYSDRWVSDAELDITSWWPNYGTSEAPWEAIAVANLSEAAGHTAYSPDKAESHSNEWTNFISGPSLPILSSYLDQAIANTTIPYAPTMSSYISSDEALHRYANLKNWYLAHGNFWVGTGPYFLSQASWDSKSLTLQNYAQFPDPADRWSRFIAP
jgi:peptide/nickel transport system substrate-binding protein